MVSLKYDGRGAFFAGVVEAAGLGDDCVSPGSDGEGIVA